MKFVSKKVRKAVAMLLVAIMVVGASPVALLANVADEFAEMLVPPSLVFQNVYSFNFDRTATVVVNDRVFAINNNGQFVESENLQWHWYDSPVFTMFFEDDRVGIRNRFGDVVVPAVYDSIVLGEMGLILVNQDGLWGIMQLPDYLDNAFGTERAAIIREGTGPDGFADVGYEIWRTADGTQEDGFIGELPYPGASRRVVSTAVDTDFITGGPFDEFEAFWIYSHEEGTLTRLHSWEFDAEEGSTRITVRAQTFENAPQGENTIVAEFRVANDEENPVRIAAQTFDNPAGRPIRRPVPHVLLQAGTHIATRDVNVRSGPSPDHEAIGWIPRGYTVEVLEQVNPWWVRVQFTSTQTGFVNSPLLASRGIAGVQGTSSRIVTAHRLNVRSGPGVDHSYIGVLHNGDIVHELERVSGGWVRITYNHNGFTVTGYVHGHYLT